MLQVKDILVKKSIKLSVKLRVITAPRASMGVRMMLNSLTDCSL